MIYILVLAILIYVLIPSKKVKFRFLSLKRNLIPLCLILILFLLVVFSTDSFSSAQKGLELWAKNVVPSLLPFLICLEVLKRTNIINVIGRLLEHIIRPIFNIPGNGVFAVVMGMFSGYPVGAKFAKTLREEGKCSKVEGERLLAFTNTSGPLFIIGSIGIGMMSDKKIGFLLLITHFVSALLVGVVFRFYKAKSIKDNKLSNFNTEARISTSKSINYNASSNFNDEARISTSKSINYNALSNFNDEANFSRSNSMLSSYNKEINHSTSSSNVLKASELGSAFGEAIKNSISTLLLICGYIVLFCVLGTILDKTGITTAISNILSKFLILFGISENVAVEIAKGGFKGILEITSGLNLLSGVNIDYDILLPIMALILGFGGLSVHMQVASIISDSDLSFKPYIIGKCLHGLFAGTITYLILRYTSFFNLQTIETFSNIASQNINSATAPTSSLIIALSIIISISLITILFKKSTYEK